MRITPIVLLPRRQLPLWTALTAVRGGDEPPLSSRVERVAEFLAVHGASFFDELMAGAHLLRIELEDALAELVGRGHVGCDSYAGLRALLSHSNFGSHDDASAAKMRKARAILTTRMPRLEARGEIRGGCFVAGLSGEQFALSDAIGALRAVRNRGHDGALVNLSASDPLNLVGTVLPGAKVPRIPGARVLYRDGLALATLVAGNVEILSPLAPADEQAVRAALLRGRTPWQAPGDAAREFSRVHRP